MNKLAIVATGTETRENAPYNDKQYDIWIFNEAATSAWCKRYDVVFQMHKPDIYKGHNTKDPNHWAWLKEKHDKPVYMQALDPEVPDSVAYPLQQALELAESKYLSATICYAIALALLQGYKEIHIFGVELSMTEYQYQAECIRFWVGLAKGKLGANKAVMHSGQHLFTAPLYGYEGDVAFSKEFFEKRVKMLDAEWNSAEKNALNTKKALDKVIADNQPLKMPDLVSKYQSAIQLCGEKAGALAEAERYAKFGDRLADRGGFEFAGATAQRDGEEKRILMFSKVGLIEYLGNVWTHTKNPAAAIQLKDQINQYGKLAEAYGAMLGMYRENIDYIIKYDAMVQANGGKK